MFLVRAARVRAASTLSEKLLVSSRVTASRMAFCFTQCISSVDVPGAASTNALGINESGDIVGAYIAGGVTRGFLRCR